MGSERGGTPQQIRVSRRRLFRVAATTGVLAWPIAGGLNVPFGHTALAQHGASMDKFVAQNLDRFSTRLDLLRQSLAIPGMSVAVVHRQSVVFARGFGFVDIASGVAATENTPYPVASLTKTFASAVIMRLVEDGKLDLDQPMSVYDPGYSTWCDRIRAGNPPLAATFHCDTELITARHLLTHTSQGKPGTAYAYNGLLFSRLSEIVDAVSAKGFNRSVEEDILEPLQMGDTALGTSDPNKVGVTARMAKPYRLDDNWNPVEPSAVRPPFDWVSAASGIISTVIDLAKFDVAIDRDLVYSTQSKQKAWTPGATPTGRALPYGLGWFLFGAPSDPWRMIWHYGWYPDAFSSLLLKLPDQQLTLILLACTDRASSVFRLGNGDPFRSAFVTAFLDSLVRRA